MGECFGSWLPCPPLRPVCVPKASPGSPRIFGSSPRSPPGGSLGCPYGPWGPQGCLGVPGCAQNPLVHIQCPRGAWPGCGDDDAHEGAPRVPVHGSSPLPPPPCSPCGGPSPGTPLPTTSPRPCPGPALTPRPPPGYFGYMNVTKIPAGATNIRVTDKSRNYLGRTRPIPSQSVPVRPSWCWERAWGTDWGFGKG